MIYLDNAATTLPKPPQVLDAISEALLKCGSLGRGSHEPARYASNIAYACRCEAAQMFDSEPEKIVFVQNATHGINISVNTLVNKGDRVVVSAFEHNAVLRPLFAQKADIVVAGKKVYDPEETLQAFYDAITEETKAVFCTHVSNVFGYVLPIERISDYCAQKGIPFVVDASQSAGIIPTSAKKLRTAFMIAPGHKGLFGPQGTGLLICGDILPRPFIKGGTGSLSKSMDMPMFLPDRLEAGTQNIHGIAGLLAGMKYIKHYGRGIYEHEVSLIERISASLDRGRYELFCANNGTQSGVLSFRPRKSTCEQIASQLSDAGFAVRAGLHCAALAHHTVGTIDTGTIRVSVSAMTDIRDVQAFVGFLNT